MSTPSTADTPDILSSVIFFFVDFLFVAGLNLFFVTSKKIPVLERAIFAILSVPQIALSWSIGPTASYIFEWIDTLPEYVWIIAVVAFVILCGLVFWFVIEAHMRQDMSVTNIEEALLLVHEKISSIPNNGTNIRNHDEEASTGGVGTVGQDASPTHGASLNSEPTARSCESSAVVADAIEATHSPPSKEEESIVEIETPNSPIDTPLPDYKP